MLTTKKGTESDESLRTFPNFQDKTFFFHFTTVTKNEKRSDNNELIFASDEGNFSTFLKACRSDVKLSSVGVKNQSFADGKRYRVGKLSRMSLSTRIFQASRNLSRYLDN